MQQGLISVIDMVEGQNDHVCDQTINLGIKMPGYEKKLLAEADKL